MDCDVIRKQKRYDGIGTLTVIGQLTVLYLSDDYDFYQYVDFRVSIRHFNDNFPIIAHARSGHARGGQPGAKKIGPKSKDFLLYLIVRRNWKDCLKNAQN